MSRLPLRFALAAGLLAAASAGADVPFGRVVVDDRAGDCKMVGDVDGDGMPDLVLGGSPGEDLVWYHHPSWTRTRIATPAVEWTTDGALADVDGDGDLDVVVPDGPSGSNLKWLRNPTRNVGAPDGDPFATSQWSLRTIGPVGDWAKDVHPADYDGDGRLDVATRRHDEAMIWFQTGADAWTKVAFSGVSLGSEGLGSGDVDGDGGVDLVIRGAWLRNPGGPSARTAGAWTSFAIGSAPAEFKALVVDLDRDGDAEVLFSSSEATADVRWWRTGAAGPTGAWTGATIAASVDRAHTLQAGDVDADGTVDVVVGQMHTSAGRTLRVHFNTHGDGSAWTSQLVDTTGLHNGVLEDVGRDGDLDVFGANWTGNPPVHLWVNELPPRCRPDLNQDGVVDAVDRDLLQAAYGDVGPSDLDGDGTTDGHDLALLNLAWGPCGPASECSNGLDDDGDGLVDHPADPGCGTAWDDAREDPACDDGSDNDGDGLKDLDDPQCSAAWKRSERGRTCGLLGVEALLAPALVAHRRRRVARR
jgi:hypothetical protein